ncbi:hypothetical protein [Thermodesulfovibrio hydrogeniphilus]
MEIPLKKTPETPEERKALIAEIIKQEEEIFAMSLGFLQKFMVEKLLEKGYSLNDIEINKGYEVIVSETEKFVTSVDILIRLDGKTVFAIKCTPASIDSWQRFMLAFCRTVEPYQIPFAFITDSEEGRLMNILTGEVKETMDFPSKEELMKELSNLKFIPYNEEKLPKERRILYAFDAIKCCPINVNVKCGLSD